MRFKTPQILWHNRDPLYSLDCQTSFKDGLFRVATGGSDQNIRIWNIVTNPAVKFNFLSTLSRHSKTVNIVRFSPNGQTLATGGDDSYIILWELSDIFPQAPGLDEDENAEIWVPIKSLRGHLEDVSDISWSPDGFRLLSGSVDNTTVLWDIKKGVKIFTFTESKGLVQGVSFDPMGQFLVTFSSDRSLRIYNSGNGSLVLDIKKIGTGKTLKLFHDDSLKSFFRRLCFSPDGGLLVVPCGQFENLNEDAPTNTSTNSTLVFGRDNLSKPLAYLPLPLKCGTSFAVRFNPNLFSLRDLSPSQSFLSLPYRMIFAVATDNSVLIYDTQQQHPLILLTSIHYEPITDITWSYDGLLLLISSLDGYCTFIQFEINELGDKYIHETFS